ncbi:uncharacterized protein LOC119134358 isoform X2 [Syngnathus acus]|uniref:uncharacterized protein si:ch211-250c4.3 isoform X2 n=1 Tax=Syngnathus acus TaxID=161584 RepID=UPI001885AD89|nr:uncharacterized protein si:ch211-250c4.3 isoform X2 [Syngnathus acus]XP_037126861.1 uncharacterized protein si:ch211-250c4.3 isoform X2 [Syngnathus acus]XP_037126863.1 uncharacterized protein LOC119134358 isoform X2 [Syngnathus acus]XP_037126864.1 uncharacterized protein LOC119134358 isoform X2 [Syngnathus acus]
MSVKRKKSGLIIRWQRSFSVLAPWRKGKAARDTVVDSGVVLTKLKLFGNFPATLSAACEHKLSMRGSKDSLVDCQPDDKSGQSRPRYGNADYLPGIFSGSQLTSLYKFESEDSGVELSSANSPSTGSDQSFAVHSRESSCDSSRLNPEPSARSAQQSRHGQRCDISHSEVGISSSRRELHLCEDPERDERSAAPEGDREMIEKLNFKACKQSRHDMKGSAARDDKCCILHETQEWSSNPLGSGLGYLEHICQLIETIGQLQENNLGLQKQICRLQKDARLAKTKEDLFQAHCSCAAATLAFEDMGLDLSRSGTLSDLSAVPEVSRHPLASAPTTDGGSSGRVQGTPSGGRHIQSEKRRTENGPASTKSFPA